MNDWEKLYKEKGEIQIIVRKIVKEAVPFFRKNSVHKILDLGAGTGRHSLFLAKRGFDVTAADISKTGLKIISDKVKKESLKIETKACDMKNTSFSSKYFDAVVCVNTLSKGTVDTITKTVKEISRVLKKGGIVVANGPTVKKQDYGQGDEIEPNTFMMWHHEDKDIPHHFFTEKEFLGYFKNFRILKSVTRRKNEIGKKTSYFEIIAKKK